MNASKLYHQSVLAQAIRHSLKGQAKKVLLNINPTATPKEIVTKVEDIFGDLSSKQSKMTDFYTAEQYYNESVAEWGLRLEELIQQASLKLHLTNEDKDEMLKEKFWRSLYDKDIKNATRSSFENKDSFEKIRRKARAEEHELKQQLKVQNQHRDQESEGHVLANILKKIETIESKTNTSHESKKFNA